MSKPSFKLFKYWLGLDILKAALTGDGLIQVVGNGAREHVPVEVVGGNLCLYQFGKVKEW